MELSNMAFARSKPFIIAVTGGSGSGKSTLAKLLIKHLGSDKCALILMDNFYLSANKDTTLNDRAAHNYDKPSAIDADMFYQTLQSLAKGLAVTYPIYDFKTHDRSLNCKHQAPKEFIIVDGIFALHDSRVRALIDVSIYVDASKDIAFIRRLLRDVSERGRTVESVTMQYQATVRPGYLQYILPTRSVANLVIDNNHPDFAFNLQAIMRAISKCRPTHTHLCQASFYSPAKTAPHLTNERINPHDAASSLSLEQMNSPYPR